MSSASNVRNESQMELIAYDHAEIMCIDNETTVSMFDGEKEIDPIGWGGVACNSLWEPAERVGMPDDAAIPAIGVKDFSWPNQVGTCGLFR